MAEVGGGMKTTHIDRRRGCSLSSLEAAALAHVSYRQVDYWIRSRLLPEPMVPADGKGTERRFSFLDLLRARVVARLRHEGASLQAIRRALDVLENEWGTKDPVDAGRLVVIDGESCLFEDREGLWRIFERHGLARRVVALDAGDVARELWERVVAYGKDTP
mgnify:CR=1 FL=1